MYIWKKTGNIAWVLLGILYGGCHTGEAEATFPLETTEPTLSIFSDITESVGISFEHFNGMTGQRYFVEMMGGGGAMFDYDNDGDLDLYLVQGHPLDPAWSGPDVSTPKDRLYRNDLQVQPNGTRLLQFTDVTEKSGLQATGYGMGVTTGDYNNDGWVDLYILNWGHNELWRNNGDGTFSDVTLASRTNDPGWSTGAAFLDYDLDGWLDLMVVNYDVYTFENDHPCYAASSGGRDYCNPASYPPAPDRLLRNRGDGTFEDVTFPTRIARAYGAGLGVTVADFNLDGWLDIYVANDGMENQLWMNQEGRYFQNQGILSGTAVNRIGVPEASMGVSAADFDGDGDEDLFMTHLTRETNTFYLNDGTALFQDQSQRSGLGIPSLLYTGFGTVSLDYDNDGWLDLFVANGHVGLIEAQVQQGDPFPLKQVNQLFANQEGGYFREVSTPEDPVFALAEVSRGTAMGDIDNDGDTDLLVLNNNGPARLLQNQVGHLQSWIGVRILGNTSRRDMLGAQVTLVGWEEEAVFRRVQVAGSYCSAHDPRILFGLGHENGEQTIRVHWPGGIVEEWLGLEVGRYHTLVQGMGKKADML